MATLGGLGLIGLVAALFLPGRLAPASQPGTQAERPEP